MSEQRVLVLSQPQGFSAKLRYDTFAKRISDFLNSQGIESKWLNTRAYQKEIENFKPTRIITTWPWCLSDSIIGNNQVEFVATDTNLKSTEIKPLLDNKRKITTIYVFSQNLYKKLIKYGFDKEIISCSELFPVEATLAGDYNSKIYKKSLGLDPEKIYFMVCGGGEGHSVAKLSVDLNYYFDSNSLNNCSILAFTGNNQEEYQRFKPYEMTLYHIEKIFPYMEYTQFKKYLRAIDYIIAKPGGGITSEVIALGKPGIYYSSSPNGKAIGSDTEQENAKMIHDTIKVANTYLLNPQGDFKYFIPHIQKFLENIPHQKGLAYKYKNSNIDFWRILIEDKTKAKQIKQIQKQIKKLKLDKSKFIESYDKAQSEFEQTIAIILKNGNGNLQNYKINYQILSFLSGSLCEESYKIIRGKDSFLMYFVNLYKSVQNSPNLAQEINTYFKPIQQEVDEIKQKNLQRQKEKEEEERRESQRASEEEIEFMTLYNTHIIKRIIYAQEPYNTEADIADRENRVSSKQFRQIISIISPKTTSTEDSKLNQFKKLLTQKYMAMTEYFKNGGRNSNWNNDAVFNEFHNWYRVLTSRR